MNEQRNQPSRSFLFSSTLLINGHPYKTRFGSTPMVVYVNQQPHYVRLTSLPDGVNSTQNVLRGHEPLMPPKPLNVFDKPRSPGVDNENSQVSETGEGVFLEPEFSFITLKIFQDNGSFENRAFDRLVSMLPSPKVDNLSSSSRLSQQYSMSENDHSKGQGQGQLLNTTTNVNQQIEQNLSGTIPGVDVNNLWAQLLGAGDESLKPKLLNMIWNVLYCLRPDRKCHSHWRRHSRPWCRC